VRRLLGNERAERYEFELGLGGGGGRGGGSEVSRSLSAIEFFAGEAIGGEDVARSAATRDRGPMRLQNGAADVGDQEETCALSPAMVAAKL